VIIRDSIRRSLEDGLRSLDMADAGVPLVLERPREAGHGDMSTPVAMALARTLHKNPLEIAETIAAKIELPSDIVSSVEVIKPGFINFRFADVALRQGLLTAISSGDGYGSSEIGGGSPHLIEYVSANPTGPLVIVSARAAAVGSAIVNLLNFAGFEAKSEYYVNDHGGQVNALGESFKYRLRERLGLLEPGEEIGAYPGEYLKEIAEKTPEPLCRRILEARDPARDPARDDGNAVTSAAARYAVDAILSGIDVDLEAFGIKFDIQFLESSLHPRAVRDTLEYFVGEGVTYEQDGAVYLRSTDFGDDKDRVLKKSDGNPTYFTADIAYHRNKLDRGFTRAVDLLGPDHHGHVPRMKAAMSVLGAAADWLEVLIVGWVTLFEDGKPAAMSKRKGEFVTLKDLVDDVGADVAKYFFLMRRANTPLDFDLTLARKQSDENPVYYVQYAHARISSVTRFARENGHSYDTKTVKLDKLSAGPERELMKQIVYFPLVVEGAALNMEPNRLTVYAQELAAAFHQFYHECRIVSDDRSLTSARLLLADATRQVLKTTLHLLGVSAPSSM
jgi:arginyl-tRNA synthetase